MIMGPIPETEAASFLSSVNAAVRRETGGDLNIVNKADAEAVRRAGWFAVVFVWVLGVVSDAVKTKAWQGYRRWIFSPDAWGARRPDVAAVFRAWRHEAQHVVDSARRPVWFALTYVCNPVTLTTILLTTILLSSWCLVALPVAFVWNPWRVAWEARAQLCTWHQMLRRDPEYVKAVRTPNAGVWANVVSGPKYLYAWPRSMVASIGYEILDDVRAGEYDDALRPGPAGWTLGADEGPTAWDVVRWTFRV